MHAAAPVDEYVPALQFVQTNDDVDPISSEYVPAMQLVHAADPLDDHDPALHVMHTAAEVAPLIGDAVPAAQRVQIALDDAPIADEYVPDIQLVHVDPPVEEEYVPTLHAVHVDAPADDHVPALQFEHWITADVVGAAETYLPALHVGSVDVHVMNDDPVK